MFKKNMFYLCALLFSTLLPIQSIAQTSAKNFLIPQKVKDFKFVEVEACKRDESGKKPEVSEEICLSEPLKSDLRVTILGPNERGFCHAKTGNQREVYNPIESGTGTSLINLDCTKSFINAIRIYEGNFFSLINESVFDYKDLKLTSVTNKKMIETINNEIRKSLTTKKMVLKKFIKPLIYIYSFPSQEIYFASYDMERILIIYTNGEAHLLSDFFTYIKGEETGSGISKIFRLNNRYFAVILVCAYETDSCDYCYIEFVRKTSNKTSHKSLKRESAKESSVP